MSQLNNSMREKLAALLAAINSGIPLEDDYLIDVEEEKDDS